jgi:hypothetical protein
MGDGSSIFSLFKKQNHEAILPLVEQHVPKDAVIIDADAGTGAFTKLFAKAAPHGHVYAFEPGRHLRSILSRVISLKKLRNVSLFPMGLGSKGAESACPVMKTETHTTLDQFASQHGLKKVDFIHTDAGDAQMQVLHGAHRTIGKFRPVLCLATNDDGGTPEEVRNFLRDFNYRIDHIESSGKKLTPLEAPTTRGTLWCVAEERWDGDVL